MEEKSVRLPDSFLNPLVLCKNPEMCTWKESIIQAENISGYLLTKFQSNKNQDNFVKPP